jgi:hypothetical protein
MINSKIKYDNYNYPVIIIGSGPAGVILSMELEKKGVPSLIIEMGGDKVNEGAYSLYDTESSGSYLYNGKSSRLPVFGGTTGHWGGSVQC